MKGGVPWDIGLITNIYVRYKDTYSALTYHCFLRCWGSIIKIDQHALMCFVWWEVVMTNEQNVVETYISVQDSFVTTGLVRYCKILVWWIKLVINIPTAMSQRAAISSPSKENVDKFSPTGLRTKRRWIWYACLSENMSWIHKVLSSWTLLFELTRACTAPPQMRDGTPVIPVFPPIWGHVVCWPNTCWPPNNSVNGMDCGIDFEVLATHGYLRDWAIR